MIIPRYEIKPSSIAGAGMGIFLLQDFKKGEILVVPEGVKPEQIISLEQLNALPSDSLEHESSVRWYENSYTTNVEWTDECYINHSFSPSGIWHLGFVFAQRNLKAGDELTIDYRYIIPEGETMPFLDGESGQPIIGYSWKEIMLQSMQAISQALNSNTK